MKTRLTGMLALMALATAFLLSACGGPAGNGQTPGPAEGTYSLTVTVVGPGTVVIDELGMTCRDECTARVGAGVGLTLVAEADAGKGFAGWQQGCEGVDECTATMDGDLQVRAAFAPHVLALRIEGDGRGTVRLVPPDVTCSDDCGQGYQSPVSASLSVTLEEGTVISGWSGPCSSSGTQRYCQLQVEGQTDVVLTLVQPPSAAADSYQVEQDGTLQVGPGQGVLSNDSDGGGDELRAELETGPTKGKLQLNPDGSFVYDPDPGASGGDSFSYRAVDPSGNSSGPTGVSIAILEKETFSLTVTVSGDGRVTSSPAGIDCPADCSVAFVDGTTVTLTAQANSGSRFSGWGGACSGATGNTCTLNLTSAKSATATFSLQVFELSYTSDGPGTLTFDPMGSGCEQPNCRRYGFGEEVVLTAEPDAGAEFVEWKGDCAGVTGPNCSVIMTRDRSATALFKTSAPPPPAQYALNLSLAGEGSGSVSSTPAGIACPNDCSETFADGTTVELIATASSESEFSGWQGDCASVSGASCTVEMTADRSVTAIFDQVVTEQSVTLEVRPSGSGSVGSPSGQISECREAGGSCLGEYEPGTTVSLQATPDEGHRFDGWVGCEPVDSSSCSIEVSDDSVVTVSFIPDSDGAGDGAADSSDGSANAGGAFNDGAA